MFLFITKLRWALKAFFVDKNYVSIMNFEAFICVFPLGNPLYLTYVMALWKIKKILEYSATYTM